MGKSGGKGRRGSHGKVMLNIIVSMCLILRYPDYIGFIFNTHASPHLYTHLHSSKHTQNHKYTWKIHINRSRIHPKTCITDIQNHTNTHTKTHTHTHTYIHINTHLYALLSVLNTVEWMNIVLVNSMKTQLPQCISNIIHCIT